MSPSRRSRPSRRRNTRSTLIEPLERRLLLSDVKIALGNTADTPYSLLENTHQYLYVSANMIPFDTVITAHDEVLGGSATQGTDVIITGTLTLGDILLGGGGYTIEFWDFPLPNNPSADPAIGHYIIHDDPPVVSIEALDPSGTEHADGEDADPASFRIVRTGGDLSSPLNVTFAVSGTATEGTDFVSPGSSLSVTAFSDKTIDILDDPDAEGIETIVITLTNPGTSYLFAPPGQPPLDPPAAQLQVDDNVSVKLVRIVPIAKPPGAPDLPDNVHFFNGFTQHIRVEVEGEQLSHVRVRQWVVASANLYDFDTGIALTQRAARDLYLGNPQTDLNLVSSQGQEVIDTNWDWVEPSWVHHAGGGAHLFDMQQFFVDATELFPPLLTMNDYYSYIASIQRDFRLQLKSVNRNDPLPFEHRWDYTWSNSNVTWGNEENHPLAGQPRPDGSMPNRDRPKAFCTASWKAPQRGEFLGVYGVTQ